MKPKIEIFLYVLCVIIIKHSVFCISFYSSFQKKMKYKRQKDKNLYINLLMTSWKQIYLKNVTFALVFCLLTFSFIQRIANLLPAWYYNFRVTMVTWGDPELSCCDSSTISFITGEWCMGNEREREIFLTGYQGVTSPERAIHLPLIEHWFHER